MKKRIIIADEADLMLIGIETIIKEQSLWEIIHTARSASELIEVSKELQPEVIVFNERLDQLIDVLVIVERLKQATPRSRLIVLGSLTEGLLIRDLFACGALAYLYEGDDLKDHLLPAVSAVVQERPYLSPTANSAYLLAMQSPLRDWQLDPEARTMLRLLMQGVHITEIASQMNIPMRRAYFLRHKLKQRFGATTNEHLISRAIAEGFSTPEAALEKQNVILPRRLSKLNYVESSNWIPGQTTLGRCISALIVRKVVISALPFTLPGFIISGTRREEACLIVEATSTATSAICPNCQQVSSHSHGWYPRRPQDLPCIGDGVYLALTVRRFRCLNADCPKKTFAERFSEWLPAYARRTTRLTDVVRQVGFEVSAESGRRILNWFKIKVSGDILLRIVKRTIIAPSASATIVGMDDWALRKGHHYGTIIVDQETRQVVEVLKGRGAEDVQPWFKAHPEVEVVTRDRSPEYRNALTTSAPQAQQVLDRWHLLHNLRQLAERVIVSAYSRLKKLPIPPELLPKRLMLPRPERRQKQMAASRQRRLDLYNEIQRLRQAGVSAANVALHLHRNYYTVRFYYNAPEFPERMPGRGPHSHLLSHLDYLEQRFMEGCDNAATLYRELQARGYPAPQGPVAAWLRARRLQAGEDPRIAHTNLALTNSSSILPSAYKLAWFIVLPPAKLTEGELALLEHLRQDVIIDQFYELAQAFRQMVTQRLVEHLDPWLKVAASSPLKTVRYFGKFLQDEYSFIRAALEHEWSNGQTEGQINRLKFIKRQMYGRASFELLRQKVLYHPGST